jgi:hypothetical protein
MTLTQNVSDTLSPLARFWGDAVTLKRHLVSRLVSREAS